MTRKRIDDRRLGMHRSITRRDFLYGMPALAGLLAACRVERGAAGPPATGGLHAGAGALPIPTGFDLGDDWYGPGGVGDYAPSHGNPPDVLRAAHQVRDRLFDALAARAVDTGETYDLVVVGGGFAGLAAAHHFRRLEGAGRCLILENHPIFGGEAKRNDFLVDGHHLTGPQGSNDFAVPPATGGPEDYFASLGLPRDYDYLPPEGDAAAMRLPLDNYSFLHWAADRFDVGYRLADAGGGTTGGAWERDPWGDGSAASQRRDEATRRAIARWRDGAADEQEAFRRGRADRPAAEIGPWLDAMTVKDYYEKVLALPPSVTAWVDPILASIIGLGCDAISAWWGWHFGLPGFRRASRYSGLTFHCYPGGNTVIARHFVKSLIPGAFGDASGFAGVVRQPVDFAALDRPDNPVRMRLGATVVRVEESGAVTFLKDGALHRLAARRVVMASGGWINRHVLPGLPETHKVAYESFRHSAVLVVNVALRHWRFLARLGFGACIWQGGFGFSCNIRRPMKIGATPSGDRPERLHPDDPIVLTFYVPYFTPGAPAKEQGQLGRLALLKASFADLEREIRGQMLDLFGAAGFDPATDIAGIVLNRWGHAYVNPGPGFMFGAGGQPPVSEVIRRPFGRIAIGHSELQGHQNWNGAAAEGRLAVEALLRA